MNISVPENHLKLHFERVSKSFGDLNVIDRFDNTIADGEIIALVGPSGCGKSTLLHRVAGLEHALYPWMTLLENVAVALEFQGQPAEYARNEASIWLDRVKLVGFEEYFTRIRSPAACASAAPWPARSSSGPRCCCSMNPSALWTP